MLFKHLIGSLLLTAPLTWKAIAFDQQERTKPLTKSACADLKFAEFSQWQTINDGTERGGASRSLLAPNPRGVIFSGSIGAIPGQEGLVGFAIARAPYRIQNFSSAHCIAVESFSEINAEVVLSVSDGEFPDGTRTYQFPFPLKLGPNKIQFYWSDFKAFKRGREDRSATKLDPTKVTAFGVQIRRGSQPPTRREDPASILFKILISR